MNTLTLYLKAAFHKPNKVQMQCDARPEEIVLPSIKLARQYHINPHHCKAYNKITNWQPALASIIHPCYVQTLSLAQQLEMMVHKDFPFTPMGLVHLANEVSIKYLPSQSDVLSINTFFGEVYFHKKGWVFEVITTANSHDKKSPAITATSFYLARQKHKNNEGDSNEKLAPDWVSNIVHDVNNQHDDAPTKDINTSASYRSLINFLPNIGRKYAKISGDYNPIHLFALTAKLFGFKKAIVHGMFSKALVVSHIAKGNRFYQGKFCIQTVFTSAISLPARAELRTYNQHGKKEIFMLKSKRAQIKNYTSKVNNSFDEKSYITGSIITGDTTP